MRTARVATALAAAPLLFAAPFAASASAKHIKLTGVDADGNGKTKELGTGLPNPPSCSFPKKITLKKGKRSEGVLQFTRCTIGTTGIGYTGHAKLRIGKLKGNVPHLTVRYSEFTSGGSGTISNASFTKSESLLIKGSSLPKKHGATVKVVLTT